MIAYSWVNYLNSIQVLSLIGTYSFNLISITIFSLPFLLFSKKEIKLKIFLLLFLLFILICNGFYGHLKIKKDEKLYTELKDFKIKIISPKISIDRFFQPDNEAIIIKELIELSNPNALQNTIFVFPEGALAGVDLDKLRSFKEIFLKFYSEKHKIIMGINTKKKIENSFKVYNSMVVLDNKLNLISEYNKIKLVPFGEFLPFENFFKKFGLRKIGYGYKSFSAGDERKPISFGFNDLNFIPLICYEIIYSGKVSLLPYETSFIINISEDGWFGESIGPQQHFVHSIYRAIENGKYVLRSANNGITAIINPLGVVEKQVDLYKSGYVDFIESRKIKPTLFLQYGNKIFGFIILLYIFLIISFKRIKNE